MDIRWEVKIAPETDNKNMVKRECSNMAMKRVNNRNMWPPRKRVL